ncbi:pilus assembly protein PilC [Candidatus Desantisbacteria bacterium CG2_30_40_21]|uniref:Pilus assembly protein PilC n=4 Tax=unclassified Candidatus Desantisiibacteriota TaxID=3106372 RepID=A0A2M7P3H9_9BACT|nr:MAG: pilus assembly protein PilC [Candidatus Desantisbacteria bacterium CG2_30_40_21]PIP42100.1 MAG: pilus assembly protein PilC [Candidatus Desantisbacteria bacterium CG23_combo_of_CG06-09_8_20_14_all_40_23]PIY20177.1 MAG: pilus assembly protein PilC [Candidatus Desantisbacteria bacterium CG_4_10_14_3_um_filter_40_18]PJB29378.1 MAG: pilus assembly protein PilC [Candidatus Desantisbacteria bacterium CG_4_9_14_3_um_filter_40_11]
MPTYIYKARNMDGTVVTGKIDAETQRSVIMKLKQQHLMVITAEEEKSNIFSRMTEILKFKGWVGLKDLVLFSRQLATLINAGIPIVQCLNVLIDQVDNKNFKRIIMTVREDIEKGASVTMSMGKHPNVFNQLYTSMIKSGESGGVLDEVLERIASYLESVQSLRRKVQTAMAYPGVVSCIAVGIILFLLIFVIPAFKDVFESFGAKLPLPTMILIKVSDVIKTYIVWFILFVMGVFFLGRLFITKTEKGRLLFDSLLLKIPVFGPLFRKIAVTRFARTLGTLVRSGVSILEALEIVAKTSGNKIVELAVMGARSSIREGERITDPLRECGVFPPMVIQMVSVGEETGALDTMLMKIADYYDREVDSAVSTLASLIEPLMICVLGIIVGGIVICMYLPIFMISTIVSGN